MAFGNHAICRGCWILKNGDREPHSIVISHVHRCCYCGHLTKEGIRVRDDDAYPFQLKCLGDEHYHEAVQL